MVEDITKRMKQAYTMAKMIIGMKEVFADAADGDDIGEVSDYDFRLLSVFFTDYGDEEDKAEHPLLQIRVRTSKEEENRGEEELAMVFNTYGARKPVEDIDEDLFNTAQIIEKYTEKFLVEYPDAVLRWNYMGDDDEDI